MHGQTNQLFFHTTPWNGCIALCSSADISLEKGDMSAREGRSKSGPSFVSRNSLYRTYKLLRNNIRKSREIWKISFHSIFVCCYVRLSMEAYRKHKEVWVGPWWVWGCDVSIRTALLLCQLKAAVKTASIYQQPAACGGISWTQTFIRNMVIISNMMCSFHAFSHNYIFMSTVCLSYTVHFLFNPNKALFQMETETAPVQQRWVWLSCKKLKSYISVYLTVVGLFSCCFFGHTETSCKQTMISSSSSWYG